MNIEIANRLVQLRKQHGYSQDELAAKLGLSRQAVSKWERAEASPDTDNLIMLSRVYGISLDELLRTEDPIPEPEPDKGVKVTINGKPVRFNKEDGFYFSYGDDDEEYESGDSDSKKFQIKCDKNEEKSPWLMFPYPVFVSILYLGLGFAFNLWHPGWLLFLTIPIYYPIVNWFTGKRNHCFWRSFPFAMIVTLAFLAIGCIWGYWHPAWALFLLIPIYYPMVKVIDRSYRRKFGYTNGSTVRVASGPVKIDFDGNVTINGKPVVDDDDNDD